MTSQSIGNVELRYNDDGTLDECVMKCGAAFFHLEQMTDGAWWMSVTDGVGEARVNLWTKRGAAIHAKAEIWKYEKPNRGATP